MRGLAIIFLTWWAGVADSACRQGLLLALDVSGSVDEKEYVLQLNGVATALESEAVHEALFAFPDAPVSLAIFEWSSSTYQQEILDWTALTSVSVLDRVVAQLRRWVRRPAPEATGIGAALTHAAETFRRAPYCWRYTLDVSGDGKNNDWPIPRDLKADGTLAGITVNALVIGPDKQTYSDDRGVGIAELTAYYSAEIIQGPDAFVEAAFGYEDYAEAMERKLLKELSVLTLGSLR